MLVTVSQHDACQKRLRLTNVDSFLDKVTERVDGGKRIEFAHPKFQRPLIPRNIGLLNISVDFQGGR